MKSEDEITVLVDTDLDSLKDILKKNDFQLILECDYNDIYMINKDYFSDSFDDCMKHTVIIRNIIDKKRNDYFLTYKQKEYNSKREIVKQSSINVKIDSIDNTFSLLEQLGYQELIRINDHILVYSNNINEIAVQLVNNRHIYIEIEKECHELNKVYKNIKEMKEVITKYKIPFKNNDYYAKKAEVEFKERYLKK